MFISICMIPHLSIYVLHFVQPCFPLMLVESHLDVDLLGVLALAYPLINSKHTQYAIKWDICEED